MGILPLWFDGHAALLGVRWERCPCCCMSMMLLWSNGHAAPDAFALYCFICSTFVLICAKTDILVHCKLSNCSPHMEAASLDIAKAYRNSPISPNHKKYLCVYWKNSVYVQHVAIEGLATAGGIQGTVADATVSFLKFHNIQPTIKWVNNFVFFRSPCKPVMPPLAPVFHYNLSAIRTITDP